MEYDSQSWYGLNWSKWVPFSENFRNSDTSTSPGVYRIKEITTGKLMYIGQTGRNLRERVGGLRRNALKDSAPWNDPHTAAPRLWSYIKELQWSFAYSVAEYSNENRARLMLECALVSACRSETEFSPICNFGRMHPEWSSPTNKKQGIACRRVDAGQSDGCSESIAYSDYPELKYPKWGSNPWVRSGGSTVNYDAQALYLLIDNGEVVYVGETNTLRSRVSAHARKYSFESVWYYSLPNCYLKPQRLELENDLLAEFWENEKGIPEYQF